ncbi:MAG: cation:dicarboxylase symporter family transporter [Chlamydiia bacterium]|nr:cation:dicarboxylase symporter family transporter [Chlamydiia bacterium]
MLAMKFLGHRSVQILCGVVLYLVTASSLPLEIHQGLYAISLLMKDLLLWMLPITVGLFIANAIASFEKRAPFFILVLFFFEALSNGLSVWYAYGCGHLATISLPSLASCHFVDTFNPLWRFSLVKPAWWSADKGTFVGVILGLMAVFRWPFLRTVLASGKQRAEWVLTRVFARLIPLFILGFVSRMYNTNLLHQLSTQYVGFFLWLLAVLIVYLGVLFVVGSGFVRRTLFQSIKNLLPAAGVAFSSGCSLSTMPWTIEGTAKNLQNPDLAKAVIPATTNIQQIGDCIVNAFLCYLIYVHFYGHSPSLAIWTAFSTIFVLARFATAAVIGGAIFIMLPIYEHYLSFTPEMIAIILAFNVLLDPLITCSNVVANGALCRIFERTWGYALRRVTRGSASQLF